MKSREKVYMRGEIEQRKERSIQIENNGIEEFCE